MTGMCFLLTAFQMSESLFSYMTIKKCTVNMQTNNMQYLILHLQQNTDQRGHEHRSNWIIIATQFIILWLQKVTQ